MDADVGLSIVTKLTQHATPSTMLVGARQVAFAALLAAQTSAFQTFPKLPTLARERVDVISSARIAPEDGASTNFVVGRRHALSLVGAGAALGISRAPEAHAEVVYELGPVVLRTDDDASINPKVLNVGTIDPAEYRPEVTQRCFMTLAVEGSVLGTLTVDLWGKVAPKTVANFASLCTGGASGNEPSYKGSSVFRVIPDLNIGIGDVAGGGDKCVKAGTCVSSAATGGKAWPVENYDAMHTLPGMVSMARGLDGTVDSRFFVTLPADARWADGRYTGFGQLGQLDGSMAIAKKLSNLKRTSTKNSPVQRVEIIECGVL